MFLCCSVCLFLYRPFSHGALKLNVSTFINNRNYYCCLFQELKLKDEECAKLLKVRDQIGEELEELTASLFEVTPPRPHTFSYAALIKNFIAYLGLTEWLSL